MQHQSGSIPGTAAQGAAQGHEGGSLPASSGTNVAAGAQESSPSFSHVCDSGGLTEAQMEQLIAGPVSKTKSLTNKAPDKNLGNLGWGCAPSGLWADTSSNAAGNLGDELSVIDAGARKNPWQTYEPRDSDQQALGSRV